MLIVKISTRPRYALHLMLDVFRHGLEERPVHLREVALRNHLSKGYLEQLVVSLKNARLLRSTGGRSGGYRLAKPAEKTTILEIFEATIGPIQLVECVQDPESCKRSASCACRILWLLLSRRIEALLASYSLQDLAGPSGVERMLEELRAVGAKGRHGDGPAPLGEDRPA